MERTSPHPANSGKLCPVARGRRLFPDFLGPPVSSISFVCVVGARLAKRTDSIGRRFYRFLIVLAGNSPVVSITPTHAPTRAVLVVCGPWAQLEPFRATTRLTAVDSPLRRPAASDGIAELARTFFAGAVDANGLFPGRGVCAEEGGPGQCAYGQ